MRVLCVGVGVGEQVPIVRVMASPQHRGKEAFGCAALARLPCMDKAPATRARQEKGNPMIQTSMPS